MLQDTHYWISQASPLNQVPHLLYISSNLRVTKPCQWDPKTFLFSLSHVPPLFLSHSVNPLGWAGEGQHGEADILRLVSSGEARPYRSLPVWEIVKGCGPTQIRVSITNQSVSALTYTVCILSIIYSLPDINLTDLISAQLKLMH